MILYRLYNVFAVGVYVIIRQVADIYKIVVIHAVIGVGVVYDLSVLVDKKSIAVLSLIAA